MEACARRSRDAHDRPAFTLVELMVVVAILAVLMALILTGVQSLRAQSMSTTCANNLGQIGLAMQNFRTIGESPPAANDLKNKLTPYLLQAADQVFSCPATDVPTSYGANYCLERFQATDNKIVVIDAVQGDVPFIGGTEAEFRAIVPGRHKQIANALYYDGHVVGYNLATINPYDAVSGSQNVVTYWEPDRKGCESCGVRGVTGTYYLTQNWSGPAVSRKETTLNLPYGAWDGWQVPYTIPLPNCTAQVAGDFSAKFTAKIRADNPGPYTFYLRCDNEVSVYLNGSQIMSRSAGGWGYGEGNVQYVQPSAPVALTPGVWNTLELRYINYTNGGNNPANLLLQWSYPSNPTPSDIPLANLIPN